MMVRSILGLFAESPFRPLTEFAHKVGECAHELVPLFDALFEEDYERVRQLADRISELEHEADIIKDNVRDRLPRTIFLPVDRRDFLGVISSLDAIADCAEDVGILFTLREMELYEELVDPLKTLLPQVLKTVDKAIEIIDHLDLLVKAGFKGEEVDRIRKLIDELELLEHEADITQDDLARTLFTDLGDRIPAASLMLWNKILNKVGDVANTAEKAGTRVRLFVAG